MDAGHGSVRIRHSRRGQRNLGPGVDRIRVNRQRGQSRGTGAAAVEQLHGVEGVEPPTGDRPPAQRRQRVGALQDRIADLGDGGVGIDRPGQRGHAGNVRCGHARTRVGGVASAGDRAVDRPAGCAQVDRVGAVVAEIGEAVIMVGSRHRKHAVQSVVGRVVGAEVVVGGVVSGRGYKQNTGVAAGLDGGVHGRAVSAASPTVVGHPHVDVVDGPHHRGVVDRPNRVGDVSPTAAGEELQPHDRPGPVHADHAGAVVAGAGDGPGNVSAVAVVVHRVAVVVDEVVSVDVVDEPVAVVVDSVSGNLAGVGPDVGGQIDVIVVHARVDHSDHDVAASGGDVPGFCRVDVGVGRTAGLTRVVHPPERRDELVVGHRLQLLHDVQFVTCHVYVS